jgi:hypothetical protein
VARADHSPTCAFGRHHDCVHMYASTEAREGQVALCSCDCHEACRVGGRTAASFLVWRSACTCPGAEDMRRAQDQAGVDPEVLERQFESFHRELAGDEDARSERGKRALVKGYEAAAAQAAGQPVDPDDAMENPQVAMQLIVDTLANIESETAAARRLGLREAQVAEMRKSAMEFRAGIIRGFIDSRRKNRKRPGS